MSDLPKAYEAKQYEDQIYKMWEESGAFQPRDDDQAEAFSIAMPPPNATGTLHLGHSVMLAVQDIMVRYHRMKGDSTLYLPGTDHAAIATQSKVEQILAENGKTRTDLGREQFLEKVREFVADSQETIRNQVRKMGTSCDWSREKYTLDDSLNTAVNEFFKRMHDDGIIYRGDRIVNWDPVMQTTVADDELEYKEEKTKFYYFKYGPFVIGTARPETKFADKVVIVHPNDERYIEYHGKTIEVEWINGPIKATIIADPASDKDFGSGVMTITPGHSVIDFDLAQKHDLEIEQIIDFQGKLKSVAGEFEGMHIKEAREKIVEKLDKKGLLVKVDEDYVHNLSTNYRGGGTIEPQVMKQWFVDVNKKTIDWKGKQRSLKEIMQETVKSKDIQIIPDRFEKIHFNWIDNLRDWCISRQIWWGHQIPMWYEVSKDDYDKWNASDEQSSYLFQILNIEPKQTIFSEESPAKEDEFWIQDPDTLDTWFSSALWTFSTLGWPENTKELERFHPTNVMETGYDIIFFWVARMILASTYCLRSDNLPEEKCLPFKTVYLHGLIRDRNGKKMSKSNPETSIDPLDMIEKYGTDALRLSLFIGSTAGNDARLYEEKISGYRNFVNKLWNVARFAMMNIDMEKLTEEDKRDIPKPKTLADTWILEKLQTLIQETEERIEKFSFSEAAEELYRFTWMDLADWYLEIAKIEKDKDTILYFILKKILKLWHPFTPFVTEVLWKELAQPELLIESPWPKYEGKKKSQSDGFTLIQEIVSSIRNMRAEANIEPAKKIDVILVTKEESLIQENQEIIKHLGRIENLGIIQSSEGKPEKALSAFIQDTEIYIPLEGLKDLGKEKERLEKELKETLNYMKSLEGKLKNKAFVDNAPEDIVNIEKKKYTDAETKANKIQEQLKQL